MSQTSTPHALILLLPRTVFEEKSRPSASLILSELDLQTSKNLAWSCPFSLSFDLDSSCFHKSTCLHAETSDQSRPCIQGTSCLVGDIFGILGARDHTVRSSDISLAGSLINEIAYLHSALSAQMAVFTWFSSVRHRCGTCASDLKLSWSVSNPENIFANSNSSILYIASKSSSIRGTDIRIMLYPYPADYCCMEQKTREIRMHFLLQPCHSYFHCPLPVARIPRDVCCDLAPKSNYETQARIQRRLECGPGFIG